MRLVALGETEPLAELASEDERAAEVEREGLLVALVEGVPVAHRVREVVAEEEAGWVPDTVTEKDRRLGVTLLERVPEAVELCDSVPVPETLCVAVEEMVAEPEGLREGLPDCEALLVSVGELDMERERTADRESVGLEVMDLDTLLEVVKEGEEVELGETRGVADTVTERREVELGVGEPVCDLDIEEEADTVGLAVVDLEMLLVLEARGEEVEEMEKVDEPVAEGLPEELVLRLGEAVLVLVCELERDTEGEVVAEREMEEELEASGLADCVMETRGEPLVLGLPVFVRDTDTETVSVEEALWEPALGVAEPVKEPVSVTVAEEVAEEVSEATPVAVLRELTERLMLGEPLPVLLGVKVLELVASGVDVPLGVPLVLTVPVLVAVAVLVKFALVVDETVRLGVVEMLGEAEGDREAVCVDAAERLSVAVLESLGEARKVREKVWVGVGVRAAVAERTEAVRETVTLSVREDAAVSVTEGETALEGVVLEETESERLVAGVREGESERLIVPETVPVRLTKNPVNEGQEESEGVMPEVAEALVLPPKRVGVMGLVGEGMRDSVPVMVAVSLRVRLGRVL